VPDFVVVPRILAAWAQRSMSRLMTVRVIAST
jgi:hypothetical protein